MPDAVAHELNEADEKILEALASGRNLPQNLADDLDYSRQYVQNRLQMLKAADYVENLGGGLYELVDDPREDGDQEADPDIDPEALQLKIRDLRAERDELQQRLEEQAQQADADAAVGRADRVVEHVADAHSAAVTAQENPPADPATIDDVVAYLERALEVLDDAE